MPCCAITWPVGHITVPDNTTIMPFCVARVFHCYISQLPLYYYSTMLSVQPVLLCLLYCILSSKAPLYHHVLCCHHHARLCHLSVLLDVYRHFLLSLFHSGLTMAHCAITIVYYTGTVPCCAFCILLCCHGDLLHHQCVLLYNRVPFCDITVFYYDITMPYYITQVSHYTIACPIKYSQGFIVSRHSTPLCHQGLLLCYSSPHCGPYCITTVS